MFTQFFGGFLLRQGVISPEQLVQAITQESTAHIKLGTLAMHAGFMTASEVDDIKVAQTHKDRKFGELCLEKGYLTAAQVDQLLGDQYPKYLLLGQVLVESGIITQQKFQELIDLYKKENEITDDDMRNEQEQTLHSVIRSYCSQLKSSENEYFIEYLNLLFNNLIRFIGDDFTPLPPVQGKDYAATIFSSQEIQGSIHIQSILDMTTESAIAFASRYVSENFTEFDEYVQASLEDFLNLHNGLFNVNMSNNYSIELNLQPPFSQKKQVLEAQEKRYIFPVLYPFGTIHFIITEQ